MQDSRHKFFVIGDQVSRCDNDLTFGYARISQQVYDRQHSDTLVPTLNPKARENIEDSVS